jgi:ribonuclease BN (tRNA processing enzyme)
VNYFNNALVEVAPRKWVLIDCGGTAPQSLKELGIQPWEIVAVIVTHLHGDHVSGIEQLAWERYYLGPDGLPGLQSTRIIAPHDVWPGLRQVLEPCVDEIGTLTGVRKDGFSVLFGVDAITVTETVVVKIGDIEFQLHQTPHVEGPGVSKPAYGVHITNTTSKIEVYYTSDTTFRSDIGELYPDAGLIFHDCTFSPKYPLTVHTHYEELLTLPADVRGRIVLMHHTKVPGGVDVHKDGFRAAAHRHDKFAF